MDHTQLPWKIDQRADTHIVGANDRHVATSGGYASNLPADRETYTDENAANAAFIVQAVNAHQALVEALEGLREACEDVYKAGHIPALPFVQAGNALKKARGEE